jgi:hypothetical protein
VRAQRTGVNPLHTEPQKEHEWLQKLVGDWAAEGEAPMEPGQPPMKWKAVETGRSIGGLWVVCEGRGEMPGGGTSTTVLTLGYDPEKGHYVGTWYGSMMAHLWVYRGSVDAAGRTLTLDTEGPKMSGPGTAKYRESIEFLDSDHRVFRSQMLKDDGGWQEIMTAHYRRK